MRSVYQTYLITGYKYKDTTKFMLPYKLAVRSSQPIEQSQKSCKLKVKVIFIVLLVLFVNSEIVIPLGFSMMKFILIDSCSLMIMIPLYKGLKKYKGFYDKDHIIYLRHKICNMKIFPC